MSFDRGLCDSQTENSKLSVTSPTSRVGLVEPSHLVSESKKGSLIPRLKGQGSDTSVIPRLKGQGSHTYRLVYIV